MSQTLAISRSKGASNESGASTCQSCSRTVRLVPVDGRLVAVDPEVIAVVPAGRHGGTLSSATAMTGRRLHAELCDTYARESERQKTRKELLAYNKRNRRRTL
jgi:hypothetical protein